MKNLLNKLSNWEKDLVKAHSRADYLPNQLWLLLDWGVQPEDAPCMQNALDKLISHQDEENGQFLAYIEAYDRKTKSKYPMWSSALCDHNLIVSILLLAGLEDNPMVKRGIKRMNYLLKETSQEKKNDFNKPNKEGILWAIPDTTGKLKGLLHIFRQSEYCKDVVILISEKTQKEYIRYLKKRDYDYHIVGENKCNLKQALELLNEKYDVKTILTDTGSILSNLLIKLGLVSEISLLIHPVVVGKKAYNMFAHLEENLKLELIKEKSFENGYLWILYRMLE